MLHIRHFFVTVSDYVEELEPHLILVQTLQVSFHGHNLLSFREDVLVNSQTYILACLYVKTESLVRNLKHKMKQAKRLKSCKRR